MCYFQGHIKILDKLSASSLQAAQQKLHYDSELWSVARSSNPNRFKVFNDNTDHIVFQFPINRHDHMASQYFPWWDDWRPVLEPIISAATRQYQYSNGRTSRIMLARLRAGKRCKMHIDHTPSADVPHKIHIPLQTSDEAEFIIEDHIYTLRFGTAYEVNNKVLHGTNNPGRVDRIHLIFDYYNDNLVPKDTFSSYTTV